jgi:predicted RNA-binding Zn-ribbon protein involved in translation (DUF1610 family)
MSIAVGGGSFTCPHCGKFWTVEYQHHLRIFALTFKCPCKTESTSTP